jgi:hypothetical protein
MYNVSAGSCRLNFSWNKDALNGLAGKLYLVDESERKLKPFDLRTLWPANSIKTLLIE